MDKRITIPMLLGAFSLIIRLAAFASLNESNADELALLAIKSHINSLSLAANWSQKTPFCNWTGIICGAKQHPERVTAINLPNMDLGGTIAAEIGNLSFLRSLDISNNSIGGEIPSEIGSLRELRSLNLSDNHLSGGIPAILSACVELRAFDLSRNGLVGRFPAGFGNWSQLEELSLSRNYLTDISPRIYRPYSSINCQLVKFGGVRYQQEQFLWDSCVGSGTTIQFENIESSSKQPKWFQEERQLVFPLFIFFSTSFLSKYEMRFVKLSV